MAHAANIVSFEDSQEAAYRRLVRAVIRSKRAGLSNNEQAIFVAIVNLWFHHRNGREGVIRPGREKLAKRSNTSVRTVQRVLLRLREAGALNVVSNANGGGHKATRYTVNIMALMELCGVKLPENAPGNLAIVVSHITSHLAHYSAQRSEPKWLTDNNNVQPIPIHEGENVIAFPVGAK